MTNNPNQPRGPGGKFVKAGDGNPITKFRKAPLIITDEIDDQDAKLDIEGKLIASSQVTLSGDPGAPAARAAIRNPKAGVETILTARGQRKIDNYVKRFGGDPAQIISDMHAAKVSHMHRNRIAIPIESTPGVDREFSNDDIVPMNERFARNIGTATSSFDKLNSALEPADQNSEAWLAGIERELKKSMDDQVSRELDRAHRMKWIGITLDIALVSILIVAAVLWIKL